MHKTKSTAEGCEIVAGLNLASQDGRACTLCWTHSLTRWTRRRVSPSVEDIMTSTSGQEIQKPAYPSPLHEQIVEAKRLLKEADTKRLREVIIDILIDPKTKERIDRLMKEAQVLDEDPITFTNFQ